ncbi:hypothetical protein VRY54_02495 [Actinomyces sp. F1_1611]
MDRSVVLAALADLALLTGDWGLIHRQLAGAEVDSWVGAAASASQEKLRQLVATSALVEAQLGEIKGLLPEVVWEVTVGDLVG